MTHKISNKLDNLLCRFKQSIINRHDSLKNVIPDLSVHLMQVFSVEQLLTLALLLFGDFRVGRCGY
jgi:hypothetical protein